MARGLGLDIFSGLSAFPITPADPQGRVQPEALSLLLERIVAAGADSIGLLGSTGGYAFLSRHERRTAVETAVSCIGGRTALIVGVGALRTDEAAALAKDAAGAGANGLLLAPMSYTPLIDEEVYRHILAVAQGTDLPLCIYNNPGTTQFTFSEALLSRLAQVDNIIAVKMPLPASGDFEGEIARLRAGAPNGFSIGYSGDWGAADALLAGADTWYSVAAGLLPQACVELTRAARSGDRKAVEAIAVRFDPLFALFKEFGSFRVMYAIADILSLCDCKPPRPILPLPAATRSRVEDALQKLSAVQADIRAIPAKVRSGFASGIA